jgi:hypothetical protein
MKGRANDHGPEETGYEGCQGQEAGQEGRQEALADPLGN